MQVAPHSCSGPEGRYIAQCDKAGAGRNSAAASADGMCPAAKCIIDSRAPFRHTQTFMSEGGRLVGIGNRLEQGGRIFDFNGTSDRAYLADMSDALAGGMVLTFQLWGGPWLMMSWCMTRDRTQPP